MTLKCKFDFCLLNSILGGGGSDKAIIFITSRGLDYIDETITMDKDYRKVKTVLENNGFVEVEFCSFESVSKIGDEELVLVLEEMGVKYSKILELKILKEMDELKNEYHASLATEVARIPHFVDPNSKISLDLSKVRVPEVGEKMSLYFYLFLECHFVSDDNYILLLNGEFNTNENNHFRNFLQITKSDFIRIESEVPNVITLQSVKKFKDFFSESNLLHSGKFKLIKPIMTNGSREYKTKEFVYSFVEIIKNINPEHPIVIQVSLDGYFNQMLERSKEIKKELLKLKKGTILIEDIKTEASIIINQLEAKMIDYAEMDQYERASYFKKNINLLDDKLKIIDDMEEDKISIAEYMKIFSLD